MDRQPRRLAAALKIRPELGAPCGFGTFARRPAPCGGSRKLLLCSVHGFDRSGRLLVLRRWMAVSGVRPKGRNASILPSQALPWRQGAGFDSMLVCWFAGQIVPNADALVLTAQHHSSNADGRQTLDHAPPAAPKCSMSTPPQRCCRYSATSLRWQWWGWSMGVGAALMLQCAARAATPAVSAPRGRSQ